MARVTRPPLPEELPPVPHGRTARRLDWPHLPPALRTAIERRLGSPVAEAESRDSGFTPGFASVLTGEDGRRLFVKAASKKAQKPIAASYAEEARKLRLLPVEDLPAPGLAWTLDDDLWTVVAFEHVEGRPPRRPWDADELRLCLDALGQVAAVMTTWSPFLRLAPLHEEMPTLVTGWDTVRRWEPDWPHLDEAAALARSYADLPDLTFVHADGRDDNFLLTPDGRALLCDWNWPGLGPVWLDAVDLLISAWGDGLDAEALLAEHPLTADAVPEHVDAFLAALCGFMKEADTRPVPASAPHLGTHRRWYAAAAWGWLAERRGWT